MNVRVYTDAQEVLEEEIKKLTKKGELSAQELCNLKEALSAVEHIMNVIGDMPEEANNMSGNSWTITPGYRHHMSYGEGYNQGYSAGYNNGASGRRGRSATTGRYVSRGFDPEQDYSGHSVKDRMIDKLEQMIDSAKSDYERQMVMNEIDRIRSEK